MNKPEHQAIIDAVRENTRIGQSAVEKAKQDFGLTDNGDRDGPRMQAWKRGAFPLRKRVPLDQSSIDGEVSMMEIVGNVIDYMRQGREVPAAAALAVLRLRFEAFDPASLPDGENTWPEFVRRRFPFPPDKVHELLGRMVHRGGLMRCTKCGAIAGCACHCGAPYISEHPWAAEAASTAHERAAAAIATHPEKSNRLIAKEIGVAEGTVRKARKDYAPDYAPDRRVGRDRKHYPSNRDDPDDDSDSPQSQYNAYMLRADAARSFATYRAGPIDSDAVDIARDTAATWAALAEELEQQQAKRRKRK